MFKFLAGAYIGGATLVSAVFGIHRSGPPMQGPSDMPSAHEQGMMHDGDGTSTATSMHPQGGSGMGDRGMATSSMNSGKPDNFNAASAQRRGSSRVLIGRVLGISGMTISLETRIPLMMAAGTQDSSGSDAHQDEAMKPEATTTVSVDATNATVLKGFASKTASFSDIMVGSLIGVEGTLDSGTLSATAIRIDAASASATTTRRLMRARLGGPKGNPPQAASSTRLQTLIIGSRK